MPLDFPNDPVVGDIFADAGARWQWDGFKWTSLMTSGGPFLPLSGGALTGPLVLAADPVVALHAATKQYVDGHSGGSGYLPLTGGTLTGPLTVEGILEVTTGHLQLINDGSTEDAFAYVDLSADIGGMNLIRGHSPGFALTWWTLALGDGPPSADFSITRYDDAGGIIDHPLTISRATGVVTFGPIPPSTMRRLGEAPGVTATAGVGSLQGHAVNGTVIQGSGSATDFLLNNKNGAPVISVPTGGTALDFAGLHTLNGVEAAVNVRAFGARGDGVTDDATAIQMALSYIASMGGGTLFFPRGRYLMSAPGAISSNTVIEGCGAGSLLLASASFGSASHWAFFVNQNYAATPIVDTSITIRDLAFSWVNYQNGGAHSIEFSHAQSVKVLHCFFYYGGDAVAFIGCADTLIQGCSAYFNNNCPYDHWDSPQNARVIGNFATFGGPGQMVNFNASPGPGAPAGSLASGCVIADNTFVYTGSSGAAQILLSPLGHGHSVAGVVVSGNHLYGPMQVAASGATTDVTVSGNVFKGVTTNAAITFFPDADNATPGNISVTGNIIENPATGAGPLGVIRMSANLYYIGGNIITGNAFGCACYTTGYTGVVGPNDFSVGTGPVVQGTNWASSSGDLRINNGGSLEWYDTTGALVQWILQTDNNHLFYGTDGSGNRRFMFGCQQHSSTSLFQIGPNTIIGANTANNITATGNAAGGGVGFTASGTDTNITVKLLGKGTFGAFLGSFTAAVDPTIANLGPGNWMLWHNTATPSTKIYYNDAGTMRSVALT